MTTAPAFLLADIETTASGPDATVLEVGLRTCDASLNTITEASWVIPYDRPAISMFRTVADPIVQAMHDKSGLWEDCVKTWDLIETPGTGRHVEDAIRRDVVSWVAEHAPGRPPLCGSSVQHDRSWLLTWCPDLADLLHTHRIIDVSSIREWLRRVAPGALVGEPEPVKAHRVLSDLDDTVALLRFLGRAVGVTPAPMAG